MQWGDIVIESRLNSTAEYCVLLMLNVCRGANWKNERDSVYSYQYNITNTIKVVRERKWFETYICISTSSIVPQKNNFHSFVADMKVFLDCTYVPCNLLIVHKWSFFVIKMLKQLLLPNTSYMCLLKLNSSISNKTQNSFDLHR